MTAINSRTQSPAAVGSARDALYQHFAHMHRTELKPVGPLENTLVETIIHNSFQIHATQSVERETGLLAAAGLMNLNRLARYRAGLQRSTRDAFTQLRELQRLRLTPEPRAMAAAASPSLFAVPSPRPAAATNSENPRASSSEPEQPASPKPVSPRPPCPAPCDVASPPGLTASMPNPPQSNS